MTVPLLAAPADALAALKTGPFQPSGVHGLTVDIEKHE
jgi:hypothetical protein